MAKKATAAKLEVLGPLNLEGGTIEVDKADVVAIAVSQVELKLTELVDQKISEGKRLTMEAANLEKELASEAELVARAEIGPRLEAFRLAAEALSDDGPFSATLRCRLHIDHLGRTGKLQVDSQMQSRGVTHLTKWFPLPEAQAAKLVRVLELRDETVRVNREALEGRRKLANIGTLERQMRARLAEAALQKVEGGAEILSLLTGDLERSISSLPSF